MCQSPSDRGAFHSSAGMEFVLKCKCVSIPFRSGRLSQRRSRAERYCSSQIVSIPFRSGRLSQGENRLVQPPMGLCQSPSDRGAFHRPQASESLAGVHTCVNPLQIGAPFTASCGSRSASSEAVSIPFRSGRLSQLLSCRLLRGQGLVSIPFRSGRLSQRDCPGAWGSVHVSIPFRSGRLSQAEGEGRSCHRRECQSPSDRGAFHRWKSSLDIWGEL